MTLSYFHHIVYVLMYSPFSLSFACLEFQAVNSSGQDPGTVNLRAWLVHVITMINCDASVVRVEFILLILRQLSYLPSGPFMVDDLF